MGSGNDKIKHMENQNQYLHEVAITAIIVKDDKYYFKYKWTLKDFLKRGLVKFLDIEVAKQNYLRGH